MRPFPSHCVNCPGPAAKPVCHDFSPLFRRSYCTFHFLLSLSSNLLPLWFFLSLFPCLSTSDYMISPLLDLLHEGQNKCNSPCLLSVSLRLSLAWTEVGVGAVAAEFPPLCEPLRFQSSELGQEKRSSLMWSHQPSLRPHTLCPKPLFYVLPLPSISLGYSFPLFTTPRRLKQGPEGRGISFPGRTADCGC